MSQDIHQIITDQIIESIEQGAEKFQMPWHITKGNSFLPVNVETGNSYNGINILILWMIADAKGYQQNLWGTFKQWQKAGAKVIKGEKHTKGIFYKSFTKEDEETGEEKTVKFIRQIQLFNVAQVEGYEMPALPDLQDDVTTIANIENFVTNTGANVDYGGEAAFYAPHADKITMPRRELFIDDDSFDATKNYYATLLHEITHWTGHKSRLNRDQNHIGSSIENYAFEELIAEIGAAYLCADLGINTIMREDHAGYIEHWLKALKNDKKAIFKAASKAQEAVTYLHNLQPSEQIAAE